MKTYHVLFAANCSMFGYETIEAENEQDLIAKAKAMKGDFDLPDLEDIREYRIVHASEISDTGKMIEEDVIEDVSLEDEPEPKPARYSLAYAVGLLKRVFEAPPMRGSEWEKDARAFLADAEKAIPLLVEIHSFDGSVECLTKPKGVAVTIREYESEIEMDRIDGRNISGCPYTESTYEATQEIAEGYTPDDPDFVPEGAAG